MILALDYGDRFIGMAAAEPPDTPVHRRGTIDQSKQDAIKELQQMVVDDNINTVLIGMPISLSGEETEQTHKTLVFMEQLREALGAEVEVEGVDETLTSVEAAKNIATEGAAAKDEHAEAARIILADYLAAGGRL